MKSYKTPVLIVLIVLSLLSLACISCEFWSTMYTSRYGGEDRIETAVKISQGLYMDGAMRSNSHIILCTSEDYPDALAAASLSGWNFAPILINPSDELDERVKDELERLWDGFDNVNDGEEDDIIYVIGEEGALSDDIVDELEDLGFIVKRIGGKDRYETAVKIAEELEKLADDFEGFIPPPSITSLKAQFEWDSEIQNIFICTGENFPDALMASPFAHYYTFFARMAAETSYETDSVAQSADVKKAQGYLTACFEMEFSPWPILLVKKNSIPSDTLDWLLSHKDVNVYVVGGPGAVSSDVMEDLGYYMNGNVIRVAGDDRYETCVKLAEHEDIWGMFGYDRDFGDDEGLWPLGFSFATGNNFPDALTIGGTYFFPIMLTSSIDDTIDEYLDDITDWWDEGEGPPPPKGYIAGGKAAVDKETEDDIAELLSNGDFDPTTEEPTINSFDVTIDPDNDLPDVAQYDFDDEVMFDVETDEHIWNEDGMLGKVVVEDISELGGKEDPYNEDDFELGQDYGDDASDNGFSGSVLVKKKSTDPDQREVTFVARAENQAGSDTMESDSIEIYN